MPPILAKDLDLTLNVSVLDFSGGTVAFTCKNNIIVLIWVSLLYIHQLMVMSFPAGMARLFCQMLLSSRGQCKGWFQ